MHFLLPATFSPYLCVTVKAFFCNIEQGICLQLSANRFAKFLSLSTFHYCKFSLTSEFQSRVSSTSLQILDRFMVSDFFTPPVENSLNLSVLRVTRVLKTNEGSR